MYFQGVITKINWCYDNVETSWQYNKTEVNDVMTSF